VLNDTYTIHDLHAAQLALHGTTVSAGSTPLPAEVRVAEAIARARDEAAKGALHVSPEDRAVVASELSTLVAYLQTDAKIARLHRAQTRSDDLEGRAARLRHLITLFAALCLAVLAGCNEWPLGAPPYAVCLDGSVPADDREVWRAAEARWNVEIGTAVLLDADHDCDVRVRASTELDELACTLPADDHVRVFYVPALLEPCVALHELAHVLLGPGVHIAGTVLDEYGCDYPNVLAPVAQRARQKWGL
jgi:hypothetical protein